MNRQLRFIFSCTVLVCLALYSCEPQIVGPQLALGNLQIHPYIAIGDGYSAGFSNGDLSPVSTKGLYEEAQTHAFPQLIAGQFNALRPLIFNQELIAGIGSGFRMITEMEDPICESLPPRAVIRDTTHNNNWQMGVEVEETIHNLSLPHLRVSLVDSDSFGRSNPFFQRLASQNHSDYLDLIREASPAFFTLWLGTEDILDYAMTGCANPEFQATSEAEFVKKFDILLHTLEEKSGAYATGLIGNIPDITEMPYFSSVSPRYLSIEDCQGSERPIYITTGDGTNVDISVASDSDKILMPAAQEIGSDNGLPGLLGLHPENPLSDARVLDEEELKEIRGLIFRYNFIIDSLAASHNTMRGEPWLSVVDINASFDKLTDTLVEDGLVLSNEHLRGGIFSLDGIYLTPRGNAYVANTFIHHLNTIPSFRASIPTLNLTDFSGVAFP